MNTLQAARERFAEERRKAIRQDITSRLTGSPRDLLPFDPFARYLSTYARIEHREAEMIPLVRIVGSVGRYQDFTRSFLPRTLTLGDRWALVNQAMKSDRGLPPIEVFKVGQVYFVADGNHRVSAARSAGLVDIEALVTEYPVDPGLEPGDTLDAALAKAGRVHFLRETALEAHLAARADLRLTWAGGYPQMLEHIALQRLLIEDSESGRQVSTVEAARVWYDESYLPVVEAIRRQRLLRSFPRRTDADLYVWVWGVLLELHRLFGEEMDPEEGAALLALRAEVSRNRLSPLRRRLRPRAEADLPAWLVCTLE
jgi:hypothetical protein